MAPPGGSVLRSVRRQVNGLTLHVLEAGRHDDPLLILLHGFPETSIAWLQQIRLLQQAGFRVAAPDMRGYNLSDRPDGIAAYHIDTLVADILTLASAYGAVRFHLVGHDWGGLVAWRLAALHPRHLSSLVILNAPNPAIMRRQMLRHPEQAFRSSYAAFFQFPWLPEVVLRANGFAALRQTMTATARVGTFGPELLDRYRAAWAQPSALTAMLNYYRALRLRRDRTRHRIACATLVLWGLRDPFLGRHLAHASLDLCENGQLVELPDATHWLHHEYPRRVSAEIIRFLA